MRVLCCSKCLFLYGPFGYVVLILNRSPLLSPFFPWKSLQLMIPWTYPLPLAPRRHMSLKRKQVMHNFRHFAPPGKDTTNRMQKGYVWKVFLLSYGGAKGRHAKTRTIYHLVGFRVALFCLFAPKHNYTTWHKSATIHSWYMDIWSLNSSSIADK